MNVRFGDLVVLLFGLLAAGTAGCARPTSDSQQASPAAGDATAIDESAAVPPVISDIAPSGSAAEPSLSEAAEALPLAAGAQEALIRSIALNFEVDE